MPDGNGERDPLDGGINAVTARRELADRIITAIAVGAYSPGQQLPSERQLAESQHVSRVTVRGAIEIVKKKGLISSRRGRGGGNFVTEMDPGHVAAGTVQRTLAEELPALMSFVDYRCLIAAVQARTAAERRTDEEARELEHILQRFLETEDPETARDVDAELHGLIGRMARCDELAVLLTQLSAKATLGFGSEPYPKSRMAQACEEHTILVRSIIARDHERAYQMAYQHFSNTVAIISETLGEGAVIPPANVPSV